ncbi:hypothetical protein E2C01_036927 [Portunus trituberculatus]|uniref:Uncharacterized protein n=1 Tax=Portunus trituberculatus TaxID=210409 RepID=A0A5B7FFN9_PORTR|nr:hypothetical protein [Portunus trituberculatus]
MDLYRLYDNHFKFLLGKKWSFKINELLLNIHLHSMFDNNFNTTADNHSCSWCSNSTPVHVHNHIDVADY